MWKGMWLNQRGDELFCRLYNVSLYGNLCSMRTAKLELITGTAKLG